MKNTNDREETLTCDICGETIEAEDEYYRLPDGFILCGDVDCIERWLREYQMPGGFSRC